MNSTQIFILLFPSSPLQRHFYEQTPLFSPIDKPERTPSSHARGCTRNNWVIKGVTEEDQCRSCSRNVRMIPLFPENGSTLTHMKKERDVCVCPYNSHKAERQDNVVAATPEQDSGDSSSAITSAASCLGNSREENHPCCSVLISSLFCHEALHIQKCSLHPKLICEGKKPRKERFLWNLPKDVHFLRWTEAKLSILWERNILEHTPPPQAVFLCGPGLSGIQSGRIQISTCVKRALRKPSRRQEWDSTSVVFLCVPKNCCKPQRTG